MVDKERRQQATVLEGRKKDRERASYRLGGQGKRGEGERGKHKYVQRELHVYNDATFVCVCIPRVGDPAFKRRAQNTPTLIENLKN